MDCTSCGRANRTGARFCGGCGASLSPRCPACNSECEPAASFCDACGAPLAARAEARKVVTIVFADLMGSTALHERIDPESARAFMERYYAAMRGAVEAERGRVTQLLGDGVKAVFGAPRIAEDDALRAVRAAVAMQRAFRALADAQREAVGAVGLRVAVHTGEVVAQDEREIIGDPVNVAAHLQQQARDGDVLVGESTQRLVSQQVTLERVGTFALKGRAEPVTAWRVASLERPAGGPASAFVGREDELRRVLAVYEAAAGERRARLAVILGSPGLGKTRLLAELARRLGDDATVLVARCDATGGATFEPLAEALRAHLCGEASLERDALRAAVEAALPEDTAERSRIAAGVAALLAGSPGSPEETFFVVRRLLAALAAARPAVLVIDDLHWAEPLLLDFVEHLVQWGGDVPLLVLAAARPELRDRRSSLAARGGLVAEALTLAGLDAGAATRLAANAIGADELPAAIAGRVLAASEGNPLFVGELVRMLVQDGALVREGDRWITRVSLADLEMPPTIQALLAARIERLRPEERAVLERAAVVGRQFSRTAVAELLPAELRADLDARLEALRRSELIEPDTGWLLGEPVLRFHHVLIRDAAYRRLLKGTRADLHTRYADWLAARVGVAPEHDETLGWHLEQAHALLSELGPLDARARALGERAASHLAAAGRRALARDDLALAAGLLGRALERLAADSPARAELALDTCETLLAAGDVGPAARALDELSRLAGESSRLRAWHVCFAAHLAALTDPQALGDTADAVAAAAQRLAAEGDAAGEAKAHSVHALVLSRLGRIGASEGALDQALAAARRGRDRRRSNAVLAGAPLAALWGPSPVTRASGRCLDVVRVLRITQGAPAVEAVALRCQGVLEALRGRADAARRMVASSRRLVEELGITQRLLEAELFAGRIELLEGDFAAAERCLRTACEGLRAQGLDIDAAQAAALLARALLAQGRRDEALARSRESEELAGDDRIAGIAWRCVRAEALAQQGEHAAAVEVASRAVELGAATDALLDHADARMALATALRAAGRAAEADAEETRAVSLWQAKGATLLVERAQRTARGAPAEPAADVAAGAAPVRRVRENAATAAARRIEDAVKRRDGDALRATWSMRALAEAQDPKQRQEVLATFGDSLALIRSSLRLGGIQASPASDSSPVERDEIVLIEVDADGNQRRIELFAPDRLGEAIARLYAWHAELEPEGPARERAVGTARSVAQWLLQVDVTAAVAPRVEFVDHRPSGLGSALGAERIRAGHDSQEELARDIAFHIQDVFALQPDAFLLRTLTSGVDRASGGAYERPLLVLGTFGRDGLVTRIEWFEPDAAAAALARFETLTAAAGAPQRIGRLGDALALYRSDGFRIVEGHDAEVFAPDRLGDAIARLYARHANLLADGSARERAAAVARTVATLMAPLDLQRYREALAPEVEYVDRRRVGLGSVRGAEGLLRGARTLIETASDFGTRIDDVLDLRPDALLTHGVNYGSAVGGGVYETHVLQIWSFGADGRLVRLEELDDDRIAEARARFDALADAPSEPRFANAASRAVERSRDRWRARDWEGVLQAHAPTCTMEDRRSLVRMQLSSEEFFANQRVLFEVPSIEWTSELLATRGERLALMRVCFEGKALGSGSLALDHLSVVETDESGRCAALVLFDPPDVAAAYAELDRRFAAGEAAPHAELLAGLEAFDRYGPASEHPDVARFLADDFQLRSHRRLARTDSPRPRDFFIEEVRTLGELRIDSATRVRHVRVGERALIADLLEAETLEGVRFEVPLLFVLSHGGGRARSLDLYDGEQLAEAQARYAEISAPTPPAHRLVNLATRAEQAACEAIAANDFDRFAALFAPGFRSSDRRSLMQLELSREQLLEPMRPIFDMGLRRTHRIHATRGDHLALVSVRLEGSDATSGPSEVEFLQVIEVDLRGIRVAAIGFDPGDLEAGFAELDARYAARQGGAGDRRASLTHSFTQAFAARDWNALRALLAPDLVVNDHRRLGWEPLHGPAAYVQALRELTELAPDVKLRVDHAEMREPGYLYFTSWQGTREGGAFEEPSWIVCELDAEGRIRRFDQYALEQREEAEARLAAIADASAPYGLRIPPNAASRAIDVHQQAFDAGDWDALADDIAPGMRFDDRRRGVLISGDREQFIHGCRLIASTRARLSTTLLATAGDRLALAHERWSGSADGGGAYEAENISLVEVDADGRIAAIVAFDPDDRRAASLEMFERYARGEGARVLPRAALDALRAMNARDLDALRALLPADFVFHDHRRTGLGRLDFTKWLASLSQLLEQAPDLTVETLHTLATEKHGDLAISRMYGTQAGGGAFESISVRLVHFEEDRFVGVEVFELEDIERARARFEALRPDPLRIPPNAASRASDVFESHAESGNWDGLRELCSPELVFEDRRPLLRVTGDREMVVASTRVTREAGHGRVRRTRLATAGERQVLERIAFVHAGSSIAEVEVLMLREVDEDGRISRLVAFDPDDRRAAAAEMRERFFRGQAAAFAPPSRIEALRAWHDHDLARLRAALPDDFCFHDHRRTGAGRIEGADAYVRSVAALFEQSPDLCGDTLYRIATEAHGELAVGRTFGTLADGGAVESVFVRLDIHRDDRFIGLELYELDDLETARARFESLRPAAAPKPPSRDPALVLPNEATRARSRFQACVAARDWHGLTDLLTPEFRFEDRRASMRDAGNREKFVASIRLTVGVGGRMARTSLATAGALLELARMHFSVVRGGAVASEVETLQVTEVRPADGRIVAVVVFDPADREAAESELRARFERLAR